MEDLSNEWWLGDDSDCDLCGYSYNQVRFADWQDDGEYVLITNIGCYSGESYTLNEIDKLIEDIKDFELFNPVMEFDIRQTLDKFKEQYPNWKDTFTE